MSLLLLYYTFECLTEQGCLWLHVLLCLPEEQKAIKGIIKLDFAISSEYAHDDMQSLLLSS